MQSAITNSNEMYYLSNSLGMERIQDDDFSNYVERHLPQLVCKLGSMVFSSFEGANDFLENSDYEIYK
jgi:hypothetical protein